jgi:hypothetical protein
MLINTVENFKKVRNLQQPQRGIVVDNKDPRGLGRVKCVIAGMLEGRLAKLPWISPWEGGESTGSASGKAPEIGAILTIQFPFHDVYTGFYTGAWKSSVTASGAFNEDYPDVSGWRDESGNKFSVNKKKGITDFTHSSGTRVKFDSAGNLQFTSKSNIQFNSQNGKSSVTFDMSTGKLSLTGEEASLKGTKTLINSEEHEINVGNENKKVAGSSSSSIAGGASKSIGGSYSKSIAGNYNKVVTGSQDHLYAQAVTETYGLGKSTTVVAGGVEETLLAGDKELTVVLGGVSYTLLAGNYSTNIVAGNINIETLLGTFKIGTPLANIESDLAGGITVTATALYTVNSVGPMTLQSSVVAEIIAPIVKINSVTGGRALNTTFDPVVDLITGTPHIGVANVQLG